MAPATIVPRVELTSRTGNPWPIGHFSEIGLAADYIGSAKPIRPVDAPGLFGENASMLLTPA